MAFHCFSKLLPLLLPEVHLRENILKAFSMITQCAVHSEMDYALKYVYYVQTMMQVYRAWWAMKPFITESMEFLNFMTLSKWFIESI